MFLRVLHTMGRVLARHWMALAAWYLATDIAHQVLIQLAAFVGSMWTLGGLLILPFAILSRVVAFVAMLLVVRPSLPALQQLEPEEQTRRARLAEFFSATLAALLPFLVFYTVWGLLEADLRQFAGLSAAYGVKVTGTLGADSGGLVALTWTAVAVVVFALTLRTLMARYAARLPLWTAPVTVYVEALWATLLFTFISQRIVQARGWIETRAATQWLADAGDWLREHSPIAWHLFDGSGWFVANAADAILLPLAWIAIAAVVYGETLDDGQPTTTGKRSLRSLLRGLGRRVDELWDAVTLVFRAGPAAAGGFVLAFALWSMAERLLVLGALRLAGPQERAFWGDWGGTITVVPELVAEVVRVALVAAMVDAVLARLRSARDHVEPGAVAGGAGRKVEDEGAFGVGRQQVDSADRVGLVGEPAAGGLGVVAERVAAADDPVRGKPGASGA